MQSKDLGEFLKVLPNPRTPNLVTNSKPTSIKSDLSSISLIAFELKTQSFKLSTSEHAFHQLQTLSWHSSNVALTQA
jgi:hypothetical protein